MEAPASTAFKKILKTIILIIFWIFMLYQLKSALGINLFENKSVWDVLSEPFKPSPNESYFYFKNK